MKVYATLFLFFGVYLSVCIWIFLVVTDSIRKISLHGFFRAKREFVREVDRQFTMLLEDKPVEAEEIVILCRHMKSKKMKRYFLNRFIYFADRIKNKNKIKEYFKTAFPYVQDIALRDADSHYSEKSYWLMLLGEFRQDTEEINEIALKALDDESFDVRTNALRALSLIGNSGCFNRGLITACKSARYFNARHISEMIGSFEGDTEALRLQMLDSFYHNPDSYRHQVLVFLTVYSFSSSMDFVLDYLRNFTENKENIIACLRFFAACENNEQAKELIYRFLLEDDVELRAISVKLAPKYFYNEIRIIRLLSGDGYLNSMDWHVRRNSAAALIRIGLDTEEIILIMLSNQDQYAREALTYAMCEANMISYEELMELGGAENAIA